MDVIIFPDSFICYNHVRTYPNRWGMHAANIIIILCMPS